MFYFILPYALQQGEAAFIDQNILVAGKGILSPYNSIFVDVLFFLTSAIAIFLVRAKYRKLPWIGSTMVGFFFIYVIFIWMLSFAESYNTTEVFLTGRQFMYISLSYFLWIAILQSVTREQYERFLRLMFYVTPVSALIYILNSSKIITVFDPSLVYLEVDYGAETFIRDFRTIPIWLIPVLVMSVQSVISKNLPVPSPLAIANIVILPIALLFTFTRSLLFIVLMQFAFLLLLYSFQLGGRVIRNFVVFFLFACVSVMVIHKAFPSQAGYFEERLLAVKNEGGAEQNVTIRIDYVNETRTIVNQTNPLIGAGMNRNYYSRMDSIGAWIADSTIPYFLMHTGWIGVLLLFGIVLIFFIDSFFLFLKTKDWLVGYLSSFFLALLVSSLIMGGDTLMGSVWSLVNFALYTIIKLEAWRKPAPSIRQQKSEVKANLALPS